MAHKAFDHPNHQKCSLCANFGYKLMFLDVSLFCPNWALALAHKFASAQSLLFCAFPCHGGNWQHCRRPIKHWTALLIKPRIWLFFSAFRRQIIHHTIHHHADEWVKSGAGGFVVWIITNPMNEQMNCEQHNKPVGLVFVVAVICAWRTIPRIQCRVQFPAKERKIKGRKENGAQMECGHRMDRREDVAVDIDDADGWIGRTGQAEVLPLVGRKQWEGTWEDKPTGKPPTNRRGNDSTRASPYAVCKNRFWLFHTTNIVASSAAPAAGHMQFHWILVIIIMTGICCQLAGLILLLPYGVVRRFSHILNAAMRHWQQNIEEIITHRNG